MKESNPQRCIWKVPEKAQNSTTLAKAKHARAAIKMEHNLILEGFLMSVLH